MTKLVRINFLILTFTTLAVNSFAAFGGGAAFLKKGVGARALGMGGAYTSLVDDVSAIYWNPAGFAQIKKYNMSVMGASGASDEWTGLKDVIPSHTFAAISIPASKITDILGESIFAIGLINSTINNTVKSEEIDGGNDGIETGKFSDTQNTVYLSWAMPIFENINNLYVGLSFKYISEKMSSISGGNALGYDMDAGILYIFLKTLNFGWVFNKGAALTWDGGHTDNAPLTIKFAISNKFNIVEKLNIIGAVDFVQVQKEPLLANIGTEISYSDILTSSSFGLKALHLRGGINSYALENRYNVKDDINRNLTYSLGFGIDLIIFGSELRVDYALSMGNIFDQKNKISLSLFF
ncbi:MAG: hypothetical protein LBS38_01540 [Endomicrobium sp.]|jgi:hypothetical protein|nr:hypothetical protein [Endomicrobium sp.]